MRNDMPEVNDVHSMLNRTTVKRIETPTSLAELQQLVRNSRARGERLSIAGGRHAMGGQAFAQQEILLDMRALQSVLHSDVNRGLLRIEAGAMWPDVIVAARAMPCPLPGSSTWAIKQKQTGVDAVTLGGSVSANAHGRGLTFAPIGEDIESLELVMADGSLRFCSRTENSELFGLAIGGYGLFGIIYSVCLRLVPRKRVQRWVDVLDLDDAANAVYRRVAQGFSYGDFQFAIDPADDAFLQRGVFSCYRETEDKSEASPASDLNPQNWLALLKLAHTDKSKAFALYASHYLSTHGRSYDADTMQLATYLPSYAEYLAQQTAPVPTEPATIITVSESLMISELYVPPDQLKEFMHAARKVLREHDSEVIYGTIRAIAADMSSFLPWAKRDYCCIVFNLRTEHSPLGIQRSTACFRALINEALLREGSFFLTYHRWWTAEQLLKAYPQIHQFVAAKRRYDPTELFCSDWYQHLLAALKITVEPAHAAR
jgi:FAD/FMN-containing dehydrogenase